MSKTNLGEAVRHSPFVGGPHGRDSRAAAACSMTPKRPGSARIVVPDQWDQRDRPRRGGTLCYRFTSPIIGLFDKEGMPGGCPATLLRGGPMTDTSRGSLDAARWLGFEGMPRCDDDAMEPHKYLRHVLGGTFDPMALMQRTPRVIHALRSSVKNHK